VIEIGMRLAPPYLRMERYSWIARTAAFALAIIILSASIARAGWVNNGNAYIAGGNIVITPANGNQVGSAWLDSRINLNYDFDITLRMYLGSSDGGADGLSIVFQNDPRGTGAVGDINAGGEWIGMHSIYPALSVELDTYQNAVWGDPAADHIAVNEFRTAADGPGHAGAAPVSLGNIEDGADHPLRLVWNSASHSLSIYFDGILRITYTKDIAASIFGGTSQVWFGVVGSTGGAYNLQQFQPLITNSAMNVTKSVNPSSVNPGDPVTYTVSVRNNGGVTASMSDIVDQLPAGFAYRSGTSSGLTANDPSIAGQTLTWSGNWSIAPGQTRTLSFQAGSPAAPGTLYNDVTVRGSDFADLTTGPTAPVTVLASDLSTSTKAVADPDGGDPKPGDTLRYTITLNETAGHAAGGVSVTDDIPADVTGFTVISVPPGAVDNSTGDGTGANGNGRLNVTNIHVPANGSAAIVFEVTIASAAPLGTAIDNTAVVTNPSGSGASPASPTVIVADSSLPATGNKDLYLYDNLALSRTPPSSAQSELTIYGGDADTWTLTPPLAAPLTITNAVNIELWIRATRNNRQFTIELASSTAGVIGSLGSLTPPTNYGATPSTFAIPVTGNLTLPAGSTLRLTISNTSGNHNRTIYVHPYRSGVRSEIVLDALTVINVDQVTFYDAAYPGGSPIADAVPGQPVFIRALVSDPFGSFDINSAALQVIDPTGTTVINGAAMTQVYDSGAVTKIYEYAAAVPAAGSLGVWTARVTAQEGSEGLVHHTGIATLEVAAPDIVLVKSVSVFSDPVNGGTNPKAIPGALMLYTITATNQGGGAADGDSVAVTDPVPAHTSLFVGDLGAPGSGPVVFSDGSPPSGLTYTFGGLGNGTDDLDFSNDGGGTWTYTPVPDGNGVDTAVTHVRIHPKGSFNGAAGGNAPSFTLRLRARVR
jgi:uncharacterized repeat protein (TIGR01451 family)